MPVDRRFKITDGFGKPRPLWVGLAGCSGSGKTYSALELATGVQQEAGGTIGLIDTENRRAQRYRKYFEFRHVDMEPPYDSLSYLAAARAMAADGARTIIIDQLTDEHEGTGGHLEAHRAEVAKQEKRGSANKFSAWANPKAERKQLVNGLRSLDLNLILLFRARPKRTQKGSTIIDLGWMPIGATELAHECTVFLMLYPGCDGVPTWSDRSSAPGEWVFTKRQRGFREILDRPEQLSAELGRRLAKESGHATEINLDQLAEDLAACATVEAVNVYAQGQTAVWRHAGAAQQTEIRGMLSTRREDLQAEGTDHE